MLFVFCLYYIIQKSWSQVFTLKFEKLKKRTSAIRLAPALRKCCHIYCDFPSPSFLLFSLRFFSLLELPLRSSCFFYILRLFRSHLFFFCSCLFLASSVHFCFCLFLFCVSDCMCIVADSMRIVSIIYKYFLEFF